MIGEKNKSRYELLRNKTILAILDGDTQCGEIEGVKISLPYLSGSVIAGISQRFGLPASYSWNGGNKSRWEYMDDLLVHCIAKNRASDLLSFIFSKQQFADKLRGKTPEQIDSIYNHIVGVMIEQINGVLCFGDNKLSVVGNQFCVNPIGAVIEITAPAVKSIDRNYIKDLSDRAMQDVVSKNYDSAITKSRTLLEEVFCYVIEKKKETPSDAGDIGKLYKQVKQLYNMHTDRDVDRRINTLLSGLEKIVSAIAEMRNTNSDAHGVGSKRMIIADHHARLIVNSAMTMAEFVLSIGKTTQ